MRVCVFTRRRAQWVRPGAQPSRGTIDWVMKPSTACLSGRLLGRAFGCRSDRLCDLLAHRLCGRRSAGLSSRAPGGVPTLGLGLLPALLTALLLGGCVTRSVDVRPLPANPADFAVWSCARIDEELGTVQQRATDVAYAVDERAGNNILALSIGVTLFWPAILAMRPDGPEAAELARLRGRDEALRVAGQSHACPALGQEPAAARLAGFPVAVGERMVYEDRSSPRLAATEWSLELLAVRRTDVDFSLRRGAVTASALAEAPGSLWQQDLVGNIIAAPAGDLVWPRLLRSNLELGQVLSGDIVIMGDPLERARLRGQVMAVGPQIVGGRRFDAAVIELFGDAPSGNAYTAVSGAIVIDRPSGLLLRLDLTSSNPTFALQRRLVRLEAGPR